MRVEFVMAIENGEFIYFECKPFIEFKSKKIDFSINMHKIVYFDYFDLKIESLLVKTYV